MRILLVEDEKFLSEAVSHLLRKEDWQVDAAFDGAEGLRLAKTGVYDAIVLDIMLPKLPGLDVLASLRKAKIATPVIILSALSEVGDKVVGLNIGADDYLAKPFKTAELVARIKSLIRRDGFSKNMLQKNYHLEFGGLRLGIDSHELSFGEQVESLSGKEFGIMECLIGAAGSVVKKTTLIGKVWGLTEWTADNNLEVYISTLRRKLKKLTNGSVVVFTTRGVGYKLGVS